MMSLILVEFTLGVFLLFGLKINVCFFPFFDNIWKNLPSPLPLFLSPSLDRGRAFSFSSHVMDVLNQNGVEGIVPRRTPSVDLFLSNPYVVRSSQARRCSATTSVPWDDRSVRMSENEEPVGLNVFYVGGPVPHR